jgi:putative transposase
MSRAYKIQNPEGIYFLSFATVGWIDIFTRDEYKDILVSSLRHCQTEKGLQIHAWVIMTNYIHLVASVKAGFSLVDVVRDFKRHTSKVILKSILDSNTESRKDWMLAIYRNAGAYNSNHKTYQFWRQDNKPIEIYSNEVIDQKIDYVHDNPVSAGFVGEPVQWLYSSAVDYAGGNGLVEISFL